MSMERMTFTVPGDVKKRAQDHREVNWSAVVARAIRERLEAMETIEAFARKSKLTQKDVDEIAASIDANMARRMEQRLGPSSSTRTDS